MPATTQNKRQVNFEVLRILSMLFVILAHFLGWGTTHCTPNSGVGFENGHIVNSLAYPFLTSLGCMGVICFILISGYFLCTSTQLRIGGIIKTWSIAAFYSVAMMLVTKVIRHGAIEQDWIALLPLYSNQYWFLTKYIALMIMAPFLSVMINNLSKQGLIYAIAAMSFLTVTITYGIPYGNNFFSDNPFSVAPFILFFLIAAYIRLYDLPHMIMKNCGKLFVLFILLQGIGGIGLNILYMNNGEIIGGFSNGYNALSIAPATLLFLWFKQHNFTKQKVWIYIAMMAPYSFAVYLIHDNIFFRDVLWYDIIDCKPLWSTPLWFTLSILVPCMILLAGIAIDVLRDKIFAKTKINQAIKHTNKYNIDIQ